MEKRTVNINKLKGNSGQIKGLPKNPRIIKDEKFNKLVKSIKDDPEMLELREVIAYNHNEELIVICGNMRLSACKKLGIKEIPTKILPPETSIDKLKAYVIKDNIGYGDHDLELLAEEWDIDLLEEWGLDITEDDVISDYNTDEKTDEKTKTITETEKLSDLKFESCYYEPTNKPNIKLSNCIDTKKFDAKVEEINKTSLPKEIKDILKMLTYRFIKIDFENVANYYAFNASEEEKIIIERLRLVLVDNGIDGFIEDEMLKVYRQLDIYKEVGIE